MSYQEVLHYRLRVATVASMIVLAYAASCRMAIMLLEVWV